RPHFQIGGEGAGYKFGRHEDGSPLTKHQFWTVTTRALAKLGLSGVRFGTHSFRIGAASTAAALGYSPPDIQRLGFLVIAERKRVLICGHSFVFWAAHRASGTALGSQLGLSQWATIEWQGRHGLLWEGLLPLLFQGPPRMPPDVLVVHLGGNDLGFLNKPLARQVIDDLQVIKERWPGVSIIWSAMIPRKVWLDVLNPKRNNRALRNINKNIKNFLDTGLGRFLPHPCIKPHCMEVFGPDGVHLSEQGNDIFLEDIRQGLQEALGLSVGASA
ncbi:PREDICTED: uncharacterized protein LOC107106395, partial [Gekko japonicus]|uniref:1-alkyl-2-acetylglycerophosphocholine esterase n=1 Tax=Gekko japonicus TaxID=146911 RepID=A0ABM1JKM9_GEKJA